MSIPSQILPKEPAKNVSVPSNRPAPVPMNSADNKQPAGQNSEIPKGYREKLEKSLKDLDQPEETNQSEISVSNEENVEQTENEQPSLEIQSEVVAQETLLEASAIEKQTLDLETVSFEQSAELKIDSQPLPIEANSTNTDQQSFLEETDSAPKENSAQKKDQPSSSLQNALYLNSSPKNSPTKEASAGPKQTELNQAEKPAPPASLANALQNSDNAEFQPAKKNDEPKNPQSLNLDNAVSESQSEQSLQISNTEAPVAEELTTKKIKVDASKLETEINPEIEAKASNQNQQLDPAIRKEIPELVPNTNQNSSPTNNGKAIEPTLKAANPNEAVKTEPVVKEKPEFAKQQKAPSAPNPVTQLDAPKPEISLEAKQEIEAVQSTSKANPETNIAPVESRNVESIFSKQNTEAKIAAERIVEQVAQSVQKAADAGKVFKVRLDPPELGVLQIELTKVNGTIVARIETETASTQKLVLENIAQLKESLSQQGNPIDKIDVEWNQRGFEEESSSRQFGQTNSDKNQSDKNTGSSIMNSENSTEAEQDEQSNNNDQPTHTRHDEIMTGLDIKV